MIPLHGGNRFQEARRLGVSEESVLDASASLVPFPLPRRLRRCLMKALDGSALRDYPDVSHRCFREAIGKWHRVDPSMVLPGNGAAELFTWAARDAASEGVSTLPVPGFVDYVRALCCWNATYSFQQLPLSWSSKAPQHFPVGPSTEVIWITNPHNPTGQLWSRSSMEDLLKRYRLVICDEAFLPIVPNGEMQSLLPLVGDYSNLIVIRSLTKLFGIAGLRLGYAISTPERLNRWSQWRDPWPLNGLAVAAGTMLVSDHLFLKHWIARVNRWVECEGAWLHSQLESSHSLSPCPSSANYFLAHSDSSLVPLREQLARQGVLLRDCRSFEGLDERWLRIGLQNKAGNRRIIEAIKNVS